MPNNNDTASAIREVIAATSEVVLGKGHEIRLALTCLMARGHLLIEDLPGVGKTTLAHTLARLLGLQFQRIQFTSDLLPADVLGASIFERDTARFRFVAGPVFSQVVLADEINRATPKTQSALLEAMEEQQVTVDGETRPLPQPFFVIATQNPSFQIGTFPLPESQLDRFLMRISLGYPAAEAERQLLSTGDARLRLSLTKPVINETTVLALQEATAKVTVRPALVSYVQDLLASTRRHPDLIHGLSPRAGLGLLSAARAWALIDGRDHVLPEDVQAIFMAVAGHRLWTPNGRSADAALLQNLLDTTAIP